ncbi:MAG: hypothetical protein NT040_03300 [Bacteroidetes bacterium]|nr:hypothetical protein [Bacteroidota bacterium]
MKKLLVVLVLVLFGSMSYAQWSGGTGSQWLMTTGNVGIGVTGAALTGDIMVSDPSGPASLILNTDVTVPAGTGPYTLGQYDMRHLGTAGTFYRNVLRYNRDNTHYEMLQTLKSSLGTLNFLFVDLNTGAFEMQSGISTATFKNNGNVYFMNGATAGSGSVGIGVTSVGSGIKLAVNGKVTCKEVEVTLAGFPDFVFSNDYKLMSLYDVENYININKHLPEVPSATEVTEKGLNLGDMNATLLQKVEELTLYMIDLKKENDALKVRVSSLEK